GEFFLKNSNTGGAADQVVRFGAKDRQAPASPLVGISGNWNGSGGAGIGTYDPDTGVFNLQNTPANGGQVDASFKLGNGGAIPLSGDWDNDGTDEVGIYNPTSGYVSIKADNTGGAAVTNFRLGGKNTSNLACAGDFNDDGTATVALYSVAARTFTQADANTDGGGTLNQFKFGGSNVNNEPVCGNWDGM
ncbi:MAG: hypothetical protein PVF69_13545, partial [Gemmatimonadota bacterium]